jgi:hypothetical protein
MLWREVPAVIFALAAQRASSAFQNLGVATDGVPAPAIA